MDQFYRVSKENSLVPVTLDHILRKIIIQDVLLLDINMMGGKESKISVTGCPIEQLVSGQIIRVGYGPTGGKEILSVLDVSYGYMQAFGGKATIASSSFAPLQISDSKVTLGANNTVYVEGYNGVPITTIRAILEHDSNLNDVSIRALNYLSKMAVAATKQNLFVQKTILYKNAVVNNGIDAPYIEEVLSSYSDAESIYMDMLDGFRAIEIMGDKESYTRILRAGCIS